MREKIKLESTAGTGHFYTTTKNKRTQPEKMEIKKFDPVLRYQKKPAGRKSGGLFYGAIITNNYDQA